jgi:hypothetical protein
MVLAAFYFVTALLIVPIVFYTMYPVVATLHSTLASFTPSQQAQYQLDLVRNFWDWMPYYYIPLIIVWFVLYTQIKEPVWEEQME